jgi:hypothetical protein
VPRALGPIYEDLTFPWRSGQRGVWIFLAFDFTVLATVAWVLVRLPEMGPMLTALLGIMLLWTGFYASSCFLAVVETTAAGCDEVGWPDGAGLLEGWWKLLYVLWLLACCWIPVGVLWRAGLDAMWTGDWWWILPLVMVSVLFPVVLLSSLAANSQWLVWNRRMAIRMAQRPHVLVLLWVASLGLLSACATLAYMALLSPSFLLCVGIGVVWSACLLVYARLVGRAGWALSREASSGIVVRLQPAAGHADNPAIGGSRDRFSPA